MSRSQGNSRGLSLIEIVICCMLLCCALIPVANTVMRGRKIVHRSRLSFLGLQFAREELEDIRACSRDAGLVRTLASHDWRKVEGSVVRGTAAEGTCAAAVDGAFSYPELAQYVQTKASLQGDPEKGPCQVTLWVRWPSADPSAGKEDAAKSWTTVRFDTVLAGGGIR